MRIDNLLVVVIHGFFLYDAELHISSNRATPGSLHLRLCISRYDTAILIELYKCIVVEIV
jgi:hypothetical protein